MLVLLLVAHRAQVGGDPNQRCVPANADVVGYLGGGFVEVTALRRKSKQARIVGKVQGRTGVRATGQCARWWWRKRRIQVMAKLASPLMGAVVGAVPGDVALTESVPPK